MNVSTKDISSITALGTFFLRDKMQPIVSNRFVQQVLLCSVSIYTKYTGAVADTRITQWPVYPSTSDSFPCLSNQSDQLIELPTHACALSAALLHIMMIQYCINAFLAVFVIVGAALKHRRTCGTLWKATVHPHFRPTGLKRRSGDIYVHPVFLYCLILLPCVINHKNSGSTSCFHKSFNRQEFSESTGAEGKAALLPLYMERCSWIANYRKWEVRCLSLSLI